MTKTPLQIAAAELSAAFIRHPAKGEREAFYSLKDGAPEWCSDAIFAAHGEGELFPNDWTYNAAHSAALDLETAADSDEDLDEAGDAFTDSAVDVYNAARSAWLASNLNRAALCDEAAEEGLVASDAGIHERIGAGQYMEARRIWDALRSAVEERAEELEAESADCATCRDAIETRAAPCDECGAIDG